MTSHDYLPPLSAETLAMIRRKPEGWDDGPITFNPVEFEPIVEVNPKLAARLLSPPIPPELCGVGGCAYLAGHHPVNVHTWSPGAQPPPQAA